MSTFDAQILAGNSKDTPCYGNKAAVDGRKVHCPNVDHFGVGSQHNFCLKLLLIRTANFGSEWTRWLRDRDISQAPKNATGSKISEVPFRAPY